MEYYIPSSMMVELCLAYCASLDYLCLSSHFFWVFFFVCFFNCKDILDYKILTNVIVEITITTLDIHVCKKEVRKQNNN
jgi:hypothetical protein